MKVIKIKSKVTFGPKYFGSKTFVLKRKLGPKKFRSKMNVIQIIQVKKIQVKKFVGSKTFFGKKNLVHKRLGKKGCWSKIDFDTKHFLGLFF